MSGIRVGRWDCPACGHRGNIGYETSCSQCGSPRGKDTKFYLTEDAGEVTDELKLKQAKAGVDWICDYCYGDNKAIDTSCTSCGNPRTDTDINRVEREIRFDAPAPVVSSTPIKTQPKPTRKYIVFGTLIAIGVLLIVLLQSRDTTVVVTGHEWERDIRTEKYIPVIENDWQLPEGGKLIKSYRDVHHYNQVLSGYETRYRTVEKPAGTKRVKVGTRDKGNGYFEDIYETQTVYKSVRESYQEPVYKNVPVYATKYQYEIFRWKPDKSYPTHGKNSSPEWSSLVPPTTKNHRESQRFEKYIIHFKDDRENEFSEECSLDFWQKVKDGEAIQAQTNAFSTRLKHTDK